MSYKVITKVMEKKLLTEKYKTYYRILSILGIIFLTIYNISFFINFLKTKQVSNFYGIKHVESFSFYVNLFAIFGFVFTLFYPEKLEMYSLISFVYSIFITITSPENIISILMLFLGLITLSIRGFFYNTRKLKLSIIAIIYVLIELTNLRYGEKIFISSFFKKLIAMFLLFVIFTFEKRNSENNVEKKLNIPIDLSIYNDLNQEDFIIIKYLLLGNKYSAIATELKISIPTVKKRTKKIFNILGVPDLIGFHSKFNGRELLFPEF